MLDKLKAYICRRYHVKIARIGLECCFGIAAECLSSHAECDFAILSASVWNGQMKAKSQVQARMLERVDDET
jgi:hypothetical protein